MRKLVSLFLLLALLLGGCTSAAPEPTPGPAFAEEDGASAVTVLRLRDFTDADTAAMSRYMSANRWLIVGNRLYGLDYDEDLRPALCTCRLRRGQPEQFRVLVENCVPEYLTMEGSRLYFVHEGSLRRFDLRKNVCETLLEGPVRSLQIYDGALYYTDGDRRYWRAALDGSSPELLLEGPCDYVWAMPEGLLYQSESEDASLRMRLWTGEDRRLTAAAAYAPLRVGSMVWYSQKDRLGSVLCSIDFTDGRVTRYETPELRGAAELIPMGGEWLLRVCLAGDGWRQTLLRPGESEGADCGYSGYRLCDYVGETLRVDAAYDPDGRLRCFVLADAEGREIRFFGGKVLN